MNAAEVRKLFQERVNNFNRFDQAIYDAIMAAILDLAKNGSGKCESFLWTGEMNEYVKARLVKDSFTVKHINDPKQESDGGWQISWPEPPSYGPFDR